jgi:hypothetical protein
LLLHPLIAIAASVLLPMLAVVAAAAAAASAELAVVLYQPTHNARHPERSCPRHFVSNAVERIPVFALAFAFAVAFALVFTSAAAFAAVLYPPI